MTRATFAVFDGDRLAGTGFFVAAGLGVTCAHVVAGLAAPRVRWDGKWLPVAVLSAHPPSADGRALHPLPDVAFLSVGAPDGHPAVLLGERPPEPGRSLFGYGFAITDAPDGDRPHAEAVLVEVAGPSGRAIRVRGDQVVRGLSGSPLLDLDSGRVCAVLKASRDIGDVRGGWAVPVAAVEECRPGVVAANHAAHPPGTTWRDAADGRAAATAALFTGAGPRTPVAEPPDPPPSWWLDARNRAVDYLRPPMFDTLLAWCRETAPEHPIRLVVAGGGAGKSRLALELRERLDADGWIAGLVSSAADLRRVAEHLPRAGSRHRVFVAVDYAETEHEELRSLVDAVGRCEPGSVRLLLLARSAGPWWAQLNRGAQRRLLIDQTVHPLGDVAREDPIAAAEAAYRCFRDRILGAAGRAPLGLEPAWRAAASAQARMLDLHAVAFLGVVGREASDPLGGVLGHELEYATRVLAARGQVPAGDDSAIERLTLAPSLLPTADRGEATELVKRLATPLSRTFAAPESVSVALAGLYPPDGYGGFWGQLRPDRLAERLLSEVADSFGSADRTVGYLDAALGQSPFLDAVPMITVLLRAATDPGDDAAVDLIAVLRQWAAEDPRRVAPAMLVVSTTGAGGPVVLDLLTEVIGRADLPTVRTIRQNLPGNHADFAEFTELGSRILLRLNELLAGSDTDGAARERAANFHDLGASHRALGRPADALRWYRRGLAAFQALPPTGPHRRLRGACLNGIGLCQTRLGQHAAAVQTYREALVVAREAAGSSDDPQAWDGLAMVLGNLANEYRAQARYRDAVAPAQEALAIRRDLSTHDLAPADRIDVQHGLVRSLTRATDALTAVNRYAEALPLAREAVTKARAAGSVQDSRVAQITAEALSCLYGCLTVLGEPEEAADVLSEAADLYVLLQAHRAASHLDEIVVNLLNLAVLLNELGRPAEARRRAGQAHRIAQDASARDLSLIPFYLYTVARYAEVLLGAGEPAEALRLSAWAFERRNLPLPEVGQARLDGAAHSSLVHAKALLAGGRLAEAHAVAGEAIARYRDLGAQHDGAFGPQLAAAWTTMRNIGSRADNPEVTMTAGREAVAVLERLVADGDVGSEPMLADTLAMAAQDLAAFEQHLAAVPLARRAGAVAEGHSDPVSRGASAQAAHVLSIALQTIDPDAAVEAGRSAAEKMDALARENPAKWTVDRAETWTHLGAAYTVAGDPARAREASRLALEVIESYTGDDGRRTLGRCLRNYAWDLSEGGIFDVTRAAIMTERAIEVIVGLPEHTARDLMEMRGCWTNLEHLRHRLGEVGAAGRARSKIAEIDRRLAAHFGDG